MGQYYQTVICQENNYSLLDPHDFDSGLKLTEHSWMENQLVLTLCNLLYKMKSRVACIGDYADECPLHSMVWGESNLEIPKVNVNKSLSFDYKGKFLVNHSKLLYLSFDEYIEKSTDNDWCLSPILILTSQGNGQGGGDYFGVNEEVAGSWSWDLISIEDTYNPDYEKVDVYFKE